MWRAVGDGFTGASPAAPRRAAMAASALRFFTLWRRHDRQRTEPPDSRSAPWIFCCKRDLAIYLLALIKDTPR